MPDVMCTLFQPSYYWLQEIDLYHSGVDDIPDFSRFSKLEVRSAYVRTKITLLSVYFWIAIFSHPSATGQCPGRWCA